MDENEQFERLKQTYFDECSELLEVLFGLLGTLQPMETDVEKLNGIFRTVHSIKAGAGAFNFTRLVSFTHTFEALLDLIRTGTISVSEDLVTLLTRAADILYDLVVAAQNERILPEDHEAAILAQLQSWVDGAGTGSPTKAPAVNQATATSAPAERVRIRFLPHEQLLKFGNEPILILAELASLGQLDRTLDVSRLPSFEEFDPGRCYFAWTLDLETGAPLSDVEAAFEFVRDDCDLAIDSLIAEKETPVAASGPATPASGGQAGPKASSIRVDLDRLDRLVNMVGELVIAQSMVLQNISDQTEPGELSQLRGLEDLTLRTRELQESVMAIRMQPVKSVFSRMPRVVRDLSERLGKKVQLRMRGEETEVDKTVIEELSDPLTHMIRNALDHGLEGPEERGEAGKNDTGTIELSAEHRSGRIVIAISDDGRGINRDRVRDKAVERGLISEDTARAMTPHEIDQLIFAPGFSTAASVNDISGRGVGMDVVRRNIQTLGGRISVESAQGRGSKFTLTLPLTLAVLDGMLIRIADERFILPLTGIVECVSPKASDLRRLSSGAEVLSVRGEFVPLVHLHTRLGLPGAQLSAEESLVVLVETASGRKVGLVIDELVAQQQVVIKSLEENYFAIPGISGATILGDGRVALIIDVDALNESGPTGAGLDGGVGEDDDWFDRDFTALDVSGQGEMAA